MKSQEAHDLSGSLRYRKTLFQSQLFLVYELAVDEEKKFHLSSPTTLQKADYKIQIYRSTDFPINCF